MRSKRAKTTKTKTVAPKTVAAKKLARKTVAKTVTKTARARRLRSAKPARSVAAKVVKPRGAKRGARTPSRTKRKPPVGRARIPALESEVRRLKVARTKLEHRLTAAVQEIGMLRQYELRAQMLEGDLAARNAELAQLRKEATDRLGGASIVSAPNGASN